MSNSSRQVVMLLTCLSIISAPLAGRQQGEYQSASQVVHGPPENAEWQYWMASAIIGDVDNDGVPDCILGIPHASTRDEFIGGVWCYSLKAGRRLYAILGKGPNDRMGWTITSLGDVNSDGVCDYGVTTYGGESVDADVVRSNGSNGMKSVRVRSRRKHMGTMFVLSGADGSQLWTRQGKARGDFFGFSAVSGGDFNADGVHDVVVGAPSSETPGYIEILSGSDGAVLREIAEVGVTKVKARAWFGRSLATIRDISGDGIREIVVGAPTAIGSTSGRGRGYILSGGSGELIQTLGLIDSEGLFGMSLASAEASPDRGELVVGVHDITAVSYGYELDKGWVVKQRLWPRYHPRVRYDGFGESVVAVGDLDGDGVSEIAVGEYEEADSDGTYGVSVFSGATGRAMVFFDAGERQTRVCWSGDIDGDGSPELCVCTPSDSRAFILSLRRAMSSGKQALALEGAAELVLAPFND